MSASTALRAIVLVASGAALAACSVVQVRGVGTNTGNAAYDLTGPSLQAVGAEATRLCPQGYAVMRQWQRGNAAAGQGDGSTTGTAVLVALSYDLQPDQAQMSIVCRA
ncbi:MAG TPA: hypothetical protein PL196_10275 [Burkholderiaceae bacterium]|nr:hypothetical protein [Burkholderiaceae bacterium]